LPGEGREIQGPVGGPVTIKASPKLTGGTFTLIENIAGPNQGPPLHIHASEDEMWYVLEWSFRFKADENIFQAPAGSFVSFPEGPAIVSKTSERIPLGFWVMFTPSWMEGFFEQHDKLTRSTWRRTR